MRARRVSRKAASSRHLLPSGLGSSSKGPTKVGTLNRTNHALVLHRSSSGKVRWRRMRIRPAKRIRGRLRLPGDKSISHRAAMIAALAEGPSLVSNFSTSQDCASTLDCLRALGVSIEQVGTSVRVEGVGARRLREPTGPLDCGNSGSTIRMLSGILAGQSFVSTLTGDESLRSRPMNRIIEPLTLMGARVSSENGRPPLCVEGRNPLDAIRYELPVASAQVKSCVLFAGLHAVGRTEVVERLGATRDHTERMLDWFGVPVEINNELGGRSTHVAIDGPARFDGSNVSMPADISSAAFFVAAAALLPDSQLEIQDVGLNPTRNQFLKIIGAAGDVISVREVRNECNEPVGTIIVHGGALIADTSRSEVDKADGVHEPDRFELTSISRTIRGLAIPPLIDELPLLAIVGTQLEGTFEIRDAGELRLKETDRIAATVSNLRAMGAAVEEYDDGLAVAGPTRLRGALIDSYGDHRIAMAFTVAALLAEGDSEIAGAECVAVSFPEFYQLLEAVSER